MADLVGGLRRHRQERIDKRGRLDIVHGPTEAAEGHHSEGRNEALTAEYVRFTILMDWPQTSGIVVRSLAEGGRCWTGRSRTSPC